MSGYIPTLLAAWEAGNDPVCRGAPHLVIAHIPEGNPVASVDALIALTHFDIAAPGFGIGTCWAGFLSMAAAALWAPAGSAGPPGGTQVRLQPDVRPPAIQGLRHPAPEAVAGDVAVGNDTERGND